MTATANGQSDERKVAKRSNLIIALVLITGSLAAELIGALLSGSLALLADAGDMVTNVTAISVALLSLWLADRPASVERTFGLRRTEALAALFNAITLWVIAIWIFLEAYERLEEPPEVEGGIVLAAGLIVLCCNMAAAWMLHRSSKLNISVEGAFRHVLAGRPGIGRRRHLRHPDTDAGLDTRRPHHGYRHRRVHHHQFVGAMAQGVSSAGRGRAGSHRRVPALQ